VSLEGQKAIAFWPAAGPGCGHAASARARPACVGADGARSARARSLGARADAPRTHALCAGRDEEARQQYINSLNAEIQSQHQYIKLLESEGGAAGENVRGGQMRGGQDCSPGEPFASGSGAYTRACAS